MRDWTCDEKRETICAGKEDKRIVKCKKAKVISETLPSCPSYPVPPEANCVPYVKVPVLLTEQKLQIDVEAEIDFEEPVQDVKRIRKNVYITQCRVIVTHHKPCPRGKLFISGFIRKNIEFSTPECKTYKAVGGDIKDLTVKVPFRCVSEVEFNLAPPDFAGPSTETRIETLGESCACKDVYCKEDKMITGKRICEDTFINHEKFMEDIYCELVEAKIIEVDILKESHKDSCKTHYFDKMVEKMVVYLKIKLLQKQQVKLRWIKD